MIAVAAVFLFNWVGPRGSAPPRRTSLTLPKEPVSIADAAVKGSLDAGVGLVIFSDFQCPFCRRFAVASFPDIDKSLISRGKLLVAFKHLPIDAIHPNAFAASTLAECARRTGNFWRAHDELFARPSLSSEAITDLAIKENISPDSSCWMSDGPDLVRRHQKEARALGIASTPTFLLGTLHGADGIAVKRVLEGYQSADAIRTAVSSLVR